MEAIIIGDLWKNLIFLDSKCFLFYFANIKSIFGKNFIFKQIFYNWTGWTLIVSGH